MEHAIAQNARIVHDHVDAAEIVDRILHHALGVVPARNAACVRDRAARAVLLGNLGNDTRRRARIAALAGHGAADVVDHDHRPVRRQFQRGRPPDPAAGAGNNGNLSIHHAHGIFLR